MILWLRYFRNLLLRNLQLKVVSLTLAILLWIALNGEPKSEIGLKVPLEFRNSPKGVEVLGETNAVDIRLSASSSIVKRIDASEVTASIDLSDWTPGRTHLFAKREQPHCSFWRCRYQNHSEQDPLALRTDGSARWSEVHPRILGKPAEGHTIVTEVVCQPEQAELEGPASHLAALESISTDSLDVSGRVVNFFSPATPVH